MSRNDGEMHNEHLYVTSDIALAAYLLIRGLTLLGAIDTGHPRKQFGITSDDPEILANMVAYIDGMIDEYENVYCVLPTDTNVRLNFKQYYKQIKELHHALDVALRKQQ